MKTFLEMVKANGFESINDFLDSMGVGTNDTPDFTAAELKSIRSAEARTAAYLGEI